MAGVCFEKHMLKERVILGMQIIVSLNLLASGLFVMTTIDPQENEILFAAAAGWVGLVCGYWLR